MGEMSDYQRRVQRALEGNHGVWFHTEDERIAVWYGEWGAPIYDSRTWEEVDYVEIPIGGCLHDRDERIDIALTERGFDRWGRTPLEDRP